MGIWGLRLSPGNERHTRRGEIEMAGCYPTQSSAFEGDHGQDVDVRPRGRIMDITGGRKRDQWQL